MSSKKVGLIQTATLSTSFKAYVFIKAGQRQQNCSFWICSTYLNEVHLSCSLKSGIWEPRRPTATVWAAFDVVALQTGGGGRWSVFRSVQEPCSWDMSSVWFHPLLKQFPHFQGFNWCANHCILLFFSDLTPLETRTIKNTNTKRYQCGVPFMVFLFIFKYKNNSSRHIKKS